MPTRPHIITLTGVDMDTDLSGVIALSERNRSVEFGILLSRSQAGAGGRYGTFDFIREASRRLHDAEVGIALHICGSAVAAFIAGDDDLEEIVRPFDRVQLNFNAKRTPIDIAALDRRLLAHDVHGRAVITQHNSANVDVSLALMAPNHRVLFDASGGFGIRSEAWPVPLTGKQCGYAGGIGPDTVAADVEAISAIAGASYWIDMENSLRIDDRFDLASCARVLDGLEGVAPALSA